MRRLALVGLIAMVWGCGADGSGGGEEGTKATAEVCEKGETNDCSCTDGSTGAQECLSNGSGWGSCECGSSALSCKSIQADNCNGDPSDGCEASLALDGNCGECGKLCDAGTHCGVATSGGYTCVCDDDDKDGVCNADDKCPGELDLFDFYEPKGTPDCLHAMQECPLTPYKDCNSKASDGCETIIHNDDNCSACGDVCNAQYSCKSIQGGVYSCVCDDTDKDGVCDTVDKHPGADDRDWEVVLCEGTTGIGESGLCKVGDGQHCALISRVNNYVCVVKFCPAFTYDCDMLLHNGCESSDYTCGVK